MQLTSDTKQQRWIDKDLPLDLYTYIRHIYFQNLSEQSNRLTMILNCEMSCKERILMYLCIKLLSECNFTPECCYSTEFSLLEVYSGPVIVYSREYLCDSQTSLPQSFHAIW